MALGYIGRDSEINVDWMAVLAFVADNRKVTGREVAVGLGLGRMIETRHRGGTRKVHSGPAEAHRRLQRLHAWGMVTRHTPRDERGRKAGEITYEITEYGQDVLRNPEIGEEVERGKGEPTKTVVLDAAPKGTLVKGPVSLMRLVEVSSVDEILRKVPPENLWAEKKFDGWLVQVAGGRIFTRRGVDLSQNFIPLYEETRAFSGEHLLGELVYWTPEGKMDEPSVTRVANVEDPREAAHRLERMPGRFQIVFFDCLARGGDDITDRPTLRRREILEKLLRPTKKLALSPVYPFPKWKEAYDAALKEGGEGAVLKNMEAPYLYRALGEREPEPRGVWYKVKAFRTDDFIVFSASVSKKGRLLLGFGQMYHGRLVQVGDVDNLSAEMEGEMAERLLTGPFVIEIAFQERYREFPGRLRSPRFKRFRDDKPLESVQLPKEYAP